MDADYSMADLRARLIKLLHVGRRKLGMAEESYRAVIASASQGRSDSAKDLRVSELEAALAHLKKCGFKVTGDTGPRPLADDGQSRKMRALWLELHAAGKVHNSAESALAAFCKRHTGVEALQWLTSAQAQRLIEHLKQWLAR